MALLVKCKTPKAVLLLGCESDVGPMRFPVDDAVCPGIHVDVRTEIGINEQLIAQAVRKVGDWLDPRYVDVCQEFSTEVDLGDGTVATLFLATIHFQYKAAKEEWSTMPDLLRGMPKNRNRLPFLRAWQILNGALKENSKAVDIDTLAKAFGVENDPQ